MQRRSRASTNHPAGTRAECILVLNSKFHWIVLQIGPCWPRLRSGTQWISKRPVSLEPANSTSSLFSAVPIRVIHGRAEFLGYADGSVRSPAELRACFCRFATKCRRRPKTQLVGQG